ncbi:DeoR/GlpR family DNA-binding transcription regulator [Nostocoides sp. HKS02]|uniref:DeoR/GlpR family DNA-binding transcription regulator n=1 Tax=Nostocoides sp. HKS02 TaxID=1813880 RepID=UPI0012B4C5B3|nr:DeoR/GlpR family DNA-binding transcription regulator [Tetrasphaera sp. HKS02]QGN56589.1 DeoR family transcriptional regulator [Tetrasphaera sp. HKS02]
MLATQRRARIVEVVTRAGAARVADLVGELGVSDMTIRRDIDQLAARGVLERVHGGAVAVGAPSGVEPSSDEPGFRVKSALMTRQKQAIAAAAAAFVEPGMSIGISAGTTTYELARAIRAVRDLTVVTNSVPVAQLLHEAATPGQVVVLTGGVRTPSDALVGPVADAALRTLHVDLLLLGAHGVDPRAGLTTPNLVESQTNRALVGCGRRTCVLADHTKFGVVGLSSFLDLAGVDVLVTDDELPAAVRAPVADVVGELLLADTRRPEATR